MGGKFGLPSCSHLIASFSPWQLLSLLSYLKTHFPPIATTISLAP